LRGIGRRSPALHKSSLALAQKLAGAPDPARRWLGKDVLRDLTKPAVAGKFASKQKKS